MSIARRSFLKSATMTTLSAGLALSSAHLIFGQQGKKGTARKLVEGAGAGAVGDFPVPIEAEQDALFSFRASTFRPYVGDIFQIPNSRGEMIELKLTRVSEYAIKSATKIATRKARQPESFSLRFTATEQLPPFSSIHKISHPALGEFDLFLKSHETDGGTVTYEAVFNHIQ
ncbi:MAG TPA: hypothetical protein VMS31_08210 [Pyrinomonadaceae bacterium]|nr:hypothetical protein [Pyrinomonadaceae bacterium]